MAAKDWQVEQYGGIRAKAGSPSGSRRREKQNSLRHRNSIELTHKRKNSSGRIQQTSDSTPAGGREGRQFTVGNVGNNGKIYLRPVIRRAQESSQSPRPLLPATNAYTDLDLSVTANLRRSSAVTLESLWSGTRTSRTPPRRPRPSHEQSRLQSSTPPPLPRIQQRHRAHSFSTLDGKDKGGAPGTGVVKSSLDSPTPQRPKTADEASGLPVLEVQIPHYRLGSPRFSAHGTAFLHSSIYTQTSTTDELRSSIFAHADFEKMFPMPPGMVHSSPSSPWHARMRPVPNLGSALGPSSQSINPSSGNLDTRLYDDLTFPPKADDPSVVRYSPVTGAIVAATPPRLIAQITSPNFVDYDLVSDFFLTFRSFLAPSDLVTYLMARLQWAASRDDEIGKIVTVRSFVAMRHWILNYFVDDFVPDYALRVKFCDTLNSVCMALKVPPDGIMKEHRIIGELKRCWRRTCVLYWDGMNITTDDPEAPLFPGGRPGSREDILPVTSHVGRPTIDSVPAQIDAVMSRKKAIVEPETSFAEVRAADILLSAAQPRPHAVVRGMIRGHPIPRVNTLSSDFSAPVVSCSIPAIGIKRAARAMNNDHHLHSISAKPSATQGPVADGATAAAGTGRGGHSTGARPFHIHKRSGSFSDALRDRRVPLPQPKSEPQPPQMLKAVSFAGSLIRGIHLPPTQPIVRDLAPNTPVQDSHSDRSFFHRSSDPTASPQKSSTIHGPGMRKLFGSVRRVLHHRDPGYHDGQENIGRGHSSSSTVSGEPMVNGSSQSRLVGTDQGLIRIDLLAATIVEDFKAAINEQRGVEARAPAGFLREIGNKIDIMPTTPAVQMVETKPPAMHPKRPSSFTQGSKSIVIVNDTRPPLPAFMSGALPTGGSETPSSPPVPVLVDSQPGSFPTTLDEQGLPPATGDDAQRFSPTEQLVTREGMISTPSEDLLSSLGTSPLQRYGKLAKSSRSDSLRRFSSFRSKVTGIITDRSFDATTATESEIDPANDNQDRPPGRMLRRRPGGDLRAARKMGDLRQMPRPRSILSFTTRSESIDGSTKQTIRSVVTSNGDHPRERRRRFSVGALAEDAKPVSMIHIHSEKPFVRASFESEVARLAQLPDDDEDGGIESALLKLEGRFEKRSSEERSMKIGTPNLIQGNDASETLFQSGTTSEEEGFQDEDDPAGDATSKTLASPPDTLLGRDHRPSPEKRAVEEIPIQNDSYAQAIVTTSAVESEDSYSSTPILERGLSNKSFKGSHSHITHSTLSVAHPSLPRGLYHSTAEMISRHAPGSRGNEHSSGQEFLQASRAARDSIANGSFLLDDDDPSDSFLLDDDEELSDLSSELSEDTVLTPEGSTLPSATFPRVTPGTVISEIGVPFHPLRHPPSPPPIFGQTINGPTSPKRDGFTRRPPTPDASPIDRARPSESNLPTDTFVLSGNASDKVEPIATGPDLSSVHLPFILGQDSELLAQQFTLLEKDALNEIDWKELVDLRAAETSLETRNWFGFLKTKEAKGVDLVIARFNVMVKWALSEVVLTQDIEERARTISKYIHIAAHARRLRNYATMYQLVTALLSTDCSRLKQTWDLVSTADLETVDELEALVQPVRNFHQLRVEMETATVEEGCIPFLGIYTHDLMFNSQRPSKVEDTNGGPALVNFERYRTTAGVVKSLLRLLEASTRYNFQPIEGVTDKCLWMAALSDEEIRSRSKALE
ncbi:MAG: Guanine nucleotide exchange factor lte1 [Peltula sp. TS41687]|nr:MAG: Guanine nucleotide exchange factor lte1 [Peltula sp. TS41687]